MSAILSGLAATVGVWMCVTPLTGWYAGVGGTRYVDVALGALVLVLALVQLVRRTSARIAVADWTTLVLGAALVVIGIVPLGRGGGIKAGEILCGVLLVVVSWISIHLPRATGAKVFSFEGKEMMAITELVADRHGVGMKGKLMGAMPATMYVRPEELWNMLALVPTRVIFAVVRVLLLPPRMSAPRSR